MTDKEAIIARFRSHVRGKAFDPTGYNTGHDGKEGHWLEVQMGLTPNGNNRPDLLGFEMKNQTSSGKTTFGDWSPDLNLWGRNTSDPSVGRLIRDTQFLPYFGTPNPLKNNRISWSGSVVPKIGNYNNYGQKLIITSSDDIQAVYSFEDDKRENKYEIIPEDLQRYVVLGQWTRDIIKEKLERKFNDQGWFKCLKDSNGIYNEIVFGLPINYDSWLNLVKDGIVYFDCGMYQNNPRPYAQWRANNDYWDSLITERYQ
ncbi:LlaMI family restriction endonuclease [Aliivibrio fischeri]|uniref:LlaMI family restriction endonuclease n=1 Tax=Aliivibrio fischeri TaxID=668 RepID=UPI0007C45B2B|nr:LlaMI family restriction endonuclease [Aliivibrio fischeri]MCE7565830.1 LlaMI family restriction endonuclease [Aliivibrio fischeri]